MNRLLTFPVFPRARQHATGSTPTLINRVLVVLPRSAMCQRSAVPDRSMATGKNGPNTPPTRHVKRPRVKAPHEGDPFFRDVWRKFQLKVHPDLFMSYPKLREANEQSLTKLQGILAEAKSGEKSVEDVMPRRTEFLEFFLRSPNPKEFIRVPLTLKLPGGYCPNVLAEAMAALFRHAQLPQRFHWGAEYWNSSYIVVPEPANEDEEALRSEDVRTEEQFKRASSARAAGTRR